jgi:hypothetical protein
MTSSIAPLSSFVLATFLANNNAFTLHINTLPFNSRLENVQFYLSIGSSVVRTATLPPVGFTITHRAIGRGHNHIIVLLSLLVVVIVQHTRNGFGERIVARLKDGVEVWRRREGKVERHCPTLTLFPEPEVSTVSAKGAGTL